MNKYPFQLEINNKTKTYDTFSDFYRFNYDQPQIFMCIMIVETFWDFRTEAFTLFKGDIIYYSYDPNKMYLFFIHNEDGAAIQKANGDILYYLDGEKFSDKKEYERMLRLRILK